MKILSPLDSRPDFLTPGPPAASTIRFQISVLSSCRFPPTMNRVPVVLVQEVVMSPQVQEPHWELRRPQFV